MAARLTSDTLPLWLPVVGHGEAEALIQQSDMNRQGGQSEEGKRIGAGSFGFK